MKHITFAIFTHFPLTGSEAMTQFLQVGHMDEHYRKHAYKFKKYCGFICFPQKAFAQLTEKKVLSDNSYSPDTRLLSALMAVHIMCKNTAD